MDLEIKTEYWDDPKALRSFKEFMVENHSLDFTDWESAGFWDDAYTPFSFFKGDTIVSSVCIYLLDAVVNGEKTRLAQVSGVGTLPEWRRRGLNRRLTDMGLEWAQGKAAGVFLFADANAVPFYERCGFRPIDEYVEFTDAAPVSNRGGAVKLDPGMKDEREKIYEYAKGRAPVSERFGVLNEKLVMFHALYTLRDHIYEIPDLECLVFFKRDENRLSIFDIVGSRVPSMEELYPLIAGANDEIVEFHFHADRLGPDKARTRLLHGNNPFVMGAFPAERPVFPFTSRA